MTLKAVTVSVDGEGETQHKELEVVNHLMLSTDEAHRIRALGPRRRLRLTESCRIAAPL